MSNTAFSMEENQHNQSFDLGELLKSIRDDSVYVVNPFFRFRRENNFVVLYGSQGIGIWTMHLSYGVIFSLFDGKRTILDIARLTRYFTNTENEIEAVALALAHIKSLVYRMSRTQEE